MTALLLALVITADFAPCVEALEVNTVLDERGHERLTQLVAWDEWGRCEAWWMWPENGTVQREGNTYSVIWFDQQGIHRVKSPRFKRTWTGYDVEEENRKRWPLDRRRGVHRP